MRQIRFFAIVLLFLGFRLRAQEIIVNEYYDTQSQNNEWTELVVVKDDLDLRGWFIGDNNASTNNWQPKLRFNPANSFWQHMRAGTIIHLDHAQGTDESNCNDSYDYDKSDGFVRICVRNPDYFEGGNSSTNFISASGDFIHLINPSGKMVHGIGHDETPGGSVIGTPCFTTSANWTDINAAKTNTPPCPTAPFTFWKINLTAPASLQMKAGSLPEFSSHLLEAGPNQVIETSETSFGGTGNGPSNDAWLIELRSPDYEALTICPVQDATGNISLTWNSLGSVNDPFPSDNTCGFMVVRNTTGDFGIPEQGREYAVNSNYGTGSQQVKVVALLDNPPSGTLNFSENPGSGNFFYRIYPFRYKNTLNFFHPTRGRAYNTEQYVKVGGTPPILNILSDTVCTSGDTAMLQVSVTNFGIGAAVPRWYDAPNGGNLIASGAIVKIPISNITTFWLDFSDAPWCAIPRTEVKVGVRPPVFCRFDAPDTICPGSTARIAGRNGPGAIYTWETISLPPGSNSAVTSDSIFEISTAAGTEKELLIFRGKCRKDGCESAFRTDTIYALPIDCRYASADSVCEGIPAKVSGTSGAGIKYNWETFSIPAGMSVGRKDSSVFEISTSATGFRQWLVYQVQCRNQAGCLSPVMKDSIYSVPMEYKLYFDPAVPSAGKPVYVGLETEWKNWKVTDWQVNSGEIQSSNPVFMVFLPGSDIPEATAEVVFLNAEGNSFCKSTQSIRRNLPNLLLGLGDDKNRTLSFDGVLLKYLQIFNRWGKKVSDFGEGYKDSWPDKSIEPGIYFYEAGLGSGKDSIRGWVEVKR